MKGINPNTGKPTTRYSQCYTGKHKRLQDAADRLLAKDGYFSHEVDNTPTSIDPEAITEQSRLRPTWVGRA